MGDFIQLDRSFLGIRSTEERIDPDVPELLSASSHSRFNWSALLDKNRHVVVLGERGTGKTFEFKNQVELLRKQKHEAFFIPLSLCRNGETPFVYKEMQRFRKWKTNTDEGAFFFLDSVDEAVLNNIPLGDAMKFMSNFLESAFERARFFISCRVSDWRFQQDLRELTEALGISIGNQQETSDGSKGNLLTVVQIASLNEEQVRKLAEHNNIKELDQFIEAIRKENAFIFTHRPLDVSWIAGYWREHRRLGSLTELIKENVRNKLSEKTRRKSKLSDQRAFEGVKKLASVATLSGRFFFKTLDDETDSDRAEIAVDPKKVLDDWTNEEITGLLTRAIFDEATYGCVRIHHRLVQDWLAAQWIQNSSGKSLSRRKLHQLFFPSVSSSKQGKVVPKHLESCLGWLCSSNHDLKRETLKYAPEVLLGEGDPSQLPEDDLGEAIQNFSSRFSNRQGIQLDVDEPTMRRIARPALAKPIKEILTQTNVSIYVADTLLQLIAYGPVCEASDIALEIALDQSCLEPIRRAAFTAIGKAGSEEQRKQLLSLLDVNKGWSQGLAGEFVEALFPDLLDIDGLLKLLENTERRPANSGTFLDWKLRDVASRILQDQKLDFIEGILKLLEFNEVTKGNWKLNDYDWLLPCLSSLLCDYVDHLDSADQLPEPAINAIDLFRSVRYHENGPWYHVHDVDAVIERSPFLRRFLFWRKAERLWEEGKHIHRDLWKFLSWDNHDGLNYQDIEWLARDAQKMKSPRQRVLAFRALASVSVESEKKEEHQRVIEELAQKDEALGKHLRRMRNPTFYNDSSTKLYARKNKIRKKRSKENLEKSCKKLEGNLSKICSGTDVNALRYVLKQSQNSSVDRFSLERIAEKFGDTIAEAISEGLMNYWPTFDPGLPSKGGYSSRDEMLFGRIGVNLSANSGIDWSSESEETIKIAVCYSAWSLNQLPTWLDDIAEIRPDIVSGQFGHCFKSEWSWPENGSHRSSIVELVSRSGEKTRNACASNILELIEESEPQRLDILQYALEILIRTPDVSSEVVSDIACQKCNSVSVRDELFASRCAQLVIRPLKTVSSVEKHFTSIKDKSKEMVAIEPREDKRFAMLWCAWSVFDPSEAVSHLENHFTSMGVERGESITIEILKIIGQWFRRQKYSSELFQNAESLTLFIKIVYEYLPVDKDTMHEGGPFMNSRDIAEIERYPLFDCLYRIQDGETATCLRGLAELETIKFYREHLLNLADNHEARTGSREPFSIQDALKWVEDGTRQIHTGEDLFAVTLDRLDDVKIEMEEGDLSYKQLFTIAQKKAVEDPIKRWLSRQLKDKSSNQYEVTIEPEVIERNKPDIRLHKTGIDEPVSIEVKVADKWSYKELSDALKEQLVEKYLRDVNSHYGVLFLCYIGTKSSWSSGKVKSDSFTQLIENLEKEASQIRISSSHVYGLRVVGIDFS